MRRIGTMAVLAGAVALALPGAGLAWKYKFQNFFEFAPGGGVAASEITAKKCSGGKLGTYDYRSITVSQGQSGDSDLEIDIRADLPVTAKFKPLKNVSVQVTAGEDFDQATILEITNASTDFHESIEVRWDPGDLTFKHGPFVIFGNEVLSEGVTKTDFKPKDKC